ncbi:hypothetical protein JCGZ_24309 [Jatropha curcas]|uniref:Uncharacterized protein n=1 Tax=Jatropha curcas TaxID=180498 RepID=A0A067JQ55_JATCU|nr:hypothetical protein JCGZ_24309 [Jatropha curcas]
MHGWGVLKSGSLVDGARGVLGKHTLMNLCGTGVPYSTGWACLSLSSPARVCNGRARLAPPEFLLGTAVPSSMPQGVLIPDSPLISLVFSTVVLLSTGWVC